jgi:hypothetical protein
VSVQSSRPFEQGFQIEVYAQHCRIPNYEGILLPCETIPLTGIPILAAESQRVYIQPLPDGVMQLLKVLKDRPGAPPSSQPDKKRGFQLFSLIRLHASLLFPLISFATSSARYPVGSGSASIRRTVLANSRLMTWLSANSTNSSGYVSPTAVASWSTTTFRFPSVAPAATTDCPSWRRSHSATTAPHLTETSGSSAASSLPPACLPWSTARLSRACCRTSPHPHDSAVSDWSG